MVAPVLTDLKFFHCEERSALPTNGGCLSINEIAEAAMNNLWDDVLRDQRETGNTAYRKLALKIHQDGAGRLPTCEFCLDGPTLGADRMVFMAATPCDTDADITGSERIYCAGSLAQAITAGEQTVVFDIKDADDYDGIEIGDDFRLTDKLTPALTGNVEYHSVATKSLSNLRITITTDDPIANNYAAYDGDNYTGGKVGVIWSSGEVKAQVGTITKTTAAGTYDNVTIPITFNNMGADEHELVLTFSDDSGNFTAESDRHGTLATGNISSTYAPMHPTWAKELLSIPPEFWGGTWLGGDTCTIPLHAAAAYVRERRDVPVDCPPLSGNRVILCNRSEAV